MRRIYNTSILFLFLFLMNNFCKPHSILNYGVPKNILFNLCFLPTSLVSYVSLLCTAF